MGQRYQAILNHLELKFACFDINMGLPFSEFMKRQAKSYQYFSHVIVATPTDTHFRICQELVNMLDRPHILCEKPLSKNLTEVAVMLSLGIRPMFQYKQLCAIGDYSEENVSSYNYFRTGNDTLPWDCIQIIGLHEGPPKNLTLKNNSPIWRCKINSNNLSIRNMDQAYLDFFKSWHDGERMHDSFIMNAHEKVVEYIDYMDR